MQSKVSDENARLWLGWWPDEQEFVERNKPQRGLTLIGKPNVVWEHRFPTLREVASLYPEGGRNAVARFLAEQISSYLLNSPQKTAPTPEQLQEMVMQVYATMSCYSVSEIMLFFAMLKTGYWQMYNKGNILEVLEIFRHQFMEYRGRKIDEVESAKREKEREESAKRCVTYEQAKEMARQGLIPPMKNQVLVEHLTNKQTR